MMKVTGRHSKYSASTVEERIRKIQEELKSIDERIEDLSRYTESSSNQKLSVEGRGETGNSDIRNSIVGGCVHQQMYPGEKKEAKAINVHNDISMENRCGQQTEAGKERFVEYLAKNFGAERRLRNEEHIRRNKAIVMTIGALMALLWLISKIYGF